MKILVIGQNSRLSKSLVDISKKQLILVRKEIYESWFDDTLLISYLKDIGFSNNDSIIITKSIIDPNHNFYEIMKWNFLFQKKILHILENNCIKANVFFIGSIFEKTFLRNNYLESKRNLSNYILKNNFSHVKPSVIRLHTLYGIGYPHNNMFLGQIFNSLKSKTILKMTDGSQFRQYHHYNEVSIYILDILLRSKLNIKIIDITGKKWLRLKDLASSIYDYFDCLELLNIGSLKNPNNELIKENDKLITKGDFKFENPLININKYLEEILNE